MEQALITLLAEEAARIGITLGPPELAQFAVFYDEFQIWNAKMNLTAVDAGPPFIIRHFIDSLLALPSIPPAATTLLDLGTGGGMPGIPLTVYFSAVNVDKEVARSSTLSFFIVLLSLTLAANYGAGTISATVYGMAPLLIPSVLIGMLVGNMVFPHIPQRWFQLILNSIILYSACRILVEFP